MSLPPRRQRPVRYWPSQPAPVDPSELCGPRGLVSEIAQDEPADELEGDDAFWVSLLTEQRRARIDAVVEARLSSVTCVIDSLIDPHNVAAILRTSEGLGLCAVHVVPSNDTDPIAHKRVTQDADKWIDLRQHPSGAAAVQSLVSGGYSVYAGSLDAGAVLLDALPADRPTALLFGHEHEGPGKETLAACTGTFRIPMAGFVQSFNVSVAAAIALSQAVRARRRHLGTAGDLPEWKAGQRRFQCLRRRGVREHRVGHHGDVVDARRQQDFSRRGVANGQHRGARITGGAGGGGGDRVFRTGHRLPFHRSLGGALARRVRQAGLGDRGRHRFRRRPGAACDGQRAEQRNKRDPPQGGYRADGVGHAVRSSGSSTQSFCAATARATGGRATSSARRFSAATVAS